MKGVILAGGRGTRLRPVTSVVNKHVLPIYDEPMIYYPARTLTQAGIDDILVISTAEYIGKYIELLEEGFGANFSYKIQSEPHGIAHAVGLAEDFVNNEFAVILGDNIFLGDCTAAIDSYDGHGATVFLTSVDEPTVYGVASVEGGKVTKIEEKPETANSDRIATGLYLYNSSVFDIISDIEPSDRGEYEITTVNNRYIERGELSYETFEGEWFDAGTPEGVFQASKSVRQRRLTD